MCKNPPVTKPYRIPIPSVESRPWLIKKLLEIMPKGEARAKRVSRTRVHFLEREAESTAASANAAGPLCIKIPSKMVLSLCSCKAETLCESNVPSKKPWIKRPIIKVNTPLEVPD